MMEPLPKTNPGVYDDLFMPDAISFCILYPLSEKMINILHDVAIYRIHLHIPWASEHVHQHHRGFMPPCYIHHIRVESQGADVVYDRCPGLYSQFSNFCLVGIDGYGDLYFGRQGLNDRDTPFNLFFRRYRHGPWPG